MTSRQFASLLGLTVALSVLTGCPTDNRGDDNPEVADEIYGEIGEPMPAASERERTLFEKGERVARRRFSPQTGLGPTFNVSFCASCHEQPTAGGSSPRYRNFFLMAKKLEDGTINFLGKQGVHRQFDTRPPHRRPTPEEADIVATRNAIPFFGVGALAEIPADEILKRHDPEDADGDGISGRVNLVGRFGRKAQTASLIGFVRGPIFNHLGITTNPMPDEMKAELPVPSDSGAGDPVDPAEVRQRLGPEDICVTCQATPPAGKLEDNDGVEDPELSQETMFNLVSWSMLLAAPEPDEPTEQTKRGETLFKSVGCADCHVPALEGPRGLVKAYTDLLIHDMGEKLADGIRQGQATGSEFRTQPLWGIAATEPYLHDGRADNLREAILSAQTIAEQAGAIRWHGGEGKQARTNYEELTDQKRKDLLAFLRSLGGADRDSEGLIPPDQAPPAAGEYGGPVAGLDEEQRARFARGRRAFDRDIAMEDGLGPNFNGDSCRACHFEPVVGGAGPAGLAVTREGHIDPGTGQFQAPSDGTLLHRFSLDLRARPAAHDDSNVFELRQPPPLFGLGKLNRVGESELKSHADPDDADGDGISGRISRPTDGAVGRFGWKADFPTLTDFVRDALANENGLTLPTRENSVVSRPSDGDGAEDPESAGQSHRDLLFYNRTLAPPPRNREVEGETERGEQLFREVGCADCHVPTLTMRDGESVHAYTDLLLHRVMPADYRGVAGADAGMREFRTPPLWGISETEPYMHDGLSGTLDDAIRRHAGEASAVTDRYVRLSGSERRALLDFLHTL
ncbi:MAG: di-heme oxidoredictase family protein [Bradymonadaceae bacterium]